MGFWWYEVRLAAGVASLALVAGWLVGRPSVGLLVGALVYAGWQGMRLLRLLRWLQGGRLAEPPELPGVWGELAYLAHSQYLRARRRQRRLGERLKRYEATAAALPDAAVVLGRDHGIQWLNEAACRLLHLDARRDVGQRVDNLLRHPDFVAYLHGGDYAEPLVLSGLVEEDRVLQLHIVPYGQDQRLLVARDITRMHRLEAMRRDFVANVSHELRTPLAVMAGYLETLLEGSLDAGQRQALEAMQQQTTRMKHLVEDLLTISRLETGELEELDAPVDVPALLRSMLEQARRLSGEKQHELSLQADESLWLLGHERYLYSAFFNLVVNAVQYTPAGGRIELRWQRCDEGACFEVCDTGIGIPAQAIPRLTERFYRVDPGRSRAAGGTGLGLSIVKHVLIHHEGELQVDSTPGAGSTFRCVFPARRVCGPNDPQ